MKKIVSLTTLAALALIAVMSLNLATAARPNTQAGSDLLQLLPDGNGVAVIDVQRALSSALWANVSSQQKLRSTLDKMEAGASELGVKLSDIQSIALALQSSGGDPAVAITGGFDQNTVLSHLRTDAKIKLTSEKYKDYDVYRVESVPQPGREAKPSVSDQSDGVKAMPAAKPSGGESNWFVFFDPRTAVVGSKPSVRASVDVKTGSRPSIAQNTKLIEGLSQNPSAAVRFSMTMTPAMAGKIQSSDLPFPDFAGLKQVFGSIDLTSGIELIATLRSETADQAKVIAERLNGLLMMVKGFLTASSDPKLGSLSEALKSFTIVGADTDVKITGTVPSEALQQLLK